MSEEIKCFKCNKFFLKKDNLKQHFLKERCHKKISDIELYNIFEELKKENKILRKSIATENTLIQDNSKLKIDISSLKQKNETQRQQIFALKNKEYNICNIISNLHDTLIQTNEDCNGVYIAFISDDIVKFGKTSNLKKRVLKHKETFDFFNLVFFIRNIEFGKLETILKIHPNTKSNLTTLIINNVRHNELLKLDDKLSLEDVKKILIYESKKLDQIQLFKLQNQCDFDEI